MNFEEAIKQLIKDNFYDIIHDNLRTKSILSDYVRDDIYAKRLVDVFSLITSKVDVYNAFLTKGLVEGRREIADIYPSISKSVTRDEFVNAINPIASLICPDEYNEYLKNKENKEASNKSSDVATITRVNKNTTINKKVESTKIAKLQTNTKSHVVNITNYNNKNTYYPKIENINSFEIYGKNNNIEIISSNTKYINTYVDYKLTNIQFDFMLGNFKLYPLTSNSKIIIYIPNYFINHVYIQNNGGSIKISGMNSKIFSTNILDLDIGNSSISIDNASYIPTLNIKGTNANIDVKSVTNKYDFYLIKSNFNIKFHEYRNANPLIKIEASNTNGKFSLDKTPLSWKTNTSKLKTIKLLNKSIFRFNVDMKNGSFNII